VPRARRSTAPRIPTGEASLAAFFRRLKARLEPILQSDTAFIEAAYREILGRDADLDGLNHYRRVLREGLSRSAVLLSLMRSEEFTNKLVKPSVAPQVSPRALRPDRYRETVDRSNGQTIAVFDAKDSSDFDWLERAILEHGYYERPGVWNFGVDTDKRLIAEIVAAFAPARALEIGCAAGAVLSCLADLGLAAEGVEISSMAIDRAPERVRARIHKGDLLSLELDAWYDMVFGLDVFEHLNPNRIDEYLSRVAHITTDDAYLFCNIPAFGDDPIFGTVFPLYVDGWESDAVAGRPFTTLHVDDLGYPIHGHLTWADARWWVQRFERRGFVRDAAIERELHRKYDHYFNARARARKAFFVFGKETSVGRRARIVESIRAQRSHLPG
jgi:uncharacterized protein DUF4214/methyltransferase family protein